MNNRLPLYAMVGCASLLTMTSCVDDAYDLSDIDTETRINVNNLVIPVNLETVKLDNIISFDDDSKIKAVDIDGNSFYALTETGTFKSDPIHIKAVTAEHPTFNPSIETLNRTDASARKGLHAPSNLAVSYKLTPSGENFSYNASDVDESIKIIEGAALKDVVFSITMTTTETGGINIAKSYFSDVIIQLPFGMKGTPSVGTYDAKTGRWTIPSFETNGTRAEIEFKPTFIDMTANDYAFNEQTRTLDLHGEFKVLSGVVTIEPSGTPSSMPQNITFRTDYALTDLHVTAIDGIIDYEYKGIEIAPVDLSDIPDFLSCEGTNLLLANPQIYLKVNNPVENYNLKCSSGLTLTALRPEAPADLRTLAYSTNSPILITSENGYDGIHQFVAAPSKDNLNVPEGFIKNHLTFVPYTNLGDVLGVPTGYNYSEMPETIDISLTDASIPRQNVEDFKLGVDIDPVEGRYEFLAPLALKEGSIIIYNTTKDGWGSDDLDALTIETLSITAIADNATPLDAEIVAYPIDRAGNRIENVKISSNLLEANSTGKELAIVLEGEIRGLDGVIFEARVRPGSETALAPDQTISLNNVRAKVSGFYLKKL